MNLASRCREAISHVAMLKKELAMHQKRASEALAMQRQQTQRIASNLSSEMSRLSQSGSSFDEDSGGGLDVVDRIMSPARVRGRTSSSSSSQDVEENPSSSKRLTTRRSLDEDDTVADSPKNNVNAAPGRTQREESPKVFSTPNRNRNPDRWKPKIDHDPDSPGMFPTSASPKIGQQRHDNYNEEFPPDMIRDPHAPSMTNNNDETGDEEDSRSSSPSLNNVLQGRSIISMNSIDAFEASFNTKFPSAFPSNESSSGKKTSRAGDPNSTTTTEIYNPFSPSPSRSMNHDTGTYHITASPNVSPIHPTMVSSPEVVRTARTSDPQQHMFGTPVTPDDKSSHDDRSIYEGSYHTPTKDGRSVDSGGSAEPKRPEKVMSAAARARYEKAMQPRSSIPTAEQNSGKNNDNIQSSEGSATSNDKGRGFLRAGSPSALLKRIQQRRVSKQQSRGDEGSIPLHEQTMNSSGGDENEVAAPPSSTSTEGVDAADQQSNSNSGRSISARLNAKLSRRSVKQPTSYAEPALNTKLRRGDEYFPKADHQVAVTNTAAAAGQPVLGESF